MDWLLWFVVGQAVVFTLALIGWLLLRKRLAEMPAREERGMDIATIIGIISGSTLLLIGAGDEGVALAWLVHPGYMVLVFGGGLAFLLIAAPLYDVVGLVGVGMSTVIPSVGATAIPTELIQRIVGLAETARREGILALEHIVDNREDRFLAQGVRLAVDGTAPALITDIMQTELDCIGERHCRGQHLLRSCGLGFAVSGLIGGLLAVGRGEGAALAALPLLYGIALGGGLCWPLSRKLQAYGESEVLTRKLIIEGIVAIQSGDNPRIVEQKLAVFLRPLLRPQGIDRLAPTTPSSSDDTAGKVTDYTGVERARVARMVRAVVAEEEGGEEHQQAIEALAARAESGEVSLVALLAALSPLLRARVVEQMKHPPMVGSRSALRGRLEFRGLVALTDREIQTLLREVDQRDFAIACKGADQALRDQLMGNLSERVRIFITEEMSTMRVQPEDVIGAQARILAQMYQLVDQGQIALPPTEIT